MDRFVTRGAPGAREAVAKAPPKAKAKQVTLASLAKVQVLSHSTLNFGAEELGQLKRRLEDKDASPAQLLDALRVLSSLVISTADLQSSMLGRTVNQLAKHSPPGSQVARLAANLVAKWRAEVDRAKSARDGHPPSQTQRSAAPKPPPRAPAVLVDSAAAFDAEMSKPPPAVSSQRRRSSGSGSGSAPSSADRARSRAAMQAALAQGSSSGAARVSALALALEAAAHARGAPAATMLSALGVNASLRAALLSGWLDPADAAAMTGRALMSCDFMGM